MAAKNDVLTVLTETINAISAIDAHTHLDASHLSARGLHDIMLYHMVVSELYTALRFAAPVRKRNCVLSDPSPHTRQVSQSAKTDVIIHFSQ